MYKLVRRSAARFVILEGSRFGRQAWSLGQTRKVFRCCNCGLEKQPPAWAYIPVTKGSNRSDHVCRECVDTQESLATQDTKLPIGKN